MNQIPKEDIALFKKRDKINRIWKAPHRHGINYLKLMDMRKEIAEQLYKNSLNRVFNNKKTTA